MSSNQKISYTNKTHSTITVVLEPWAEEYSLCPGERVDIEVRNGSERGYLELEQTTDAMIIYSWEGTTVSIMRDGKELTPNSQR